MAPGPVWSAAGYGLSLLVARELPKLCAHPLPRVPQSWKDGWMALFCKPNKPGRRPEDYRPICLQDPMGKAMLSLLAGRIKPLVQVYAADCPQHAYLPGRSTEGALLWIFHKCRLIRDLADSSRRTIYDKRYKPAVSDSFSGGMVLSLDMSHAFDSVPRQYLQAALLDAGVARADVQLIMQWLQGSEYHLQHGRINLSILTHRGVRQGCVLSPLLWSCFTCYVAKRLPQTLKKQDLQMYADDFLMCWIFRSRADFHHALSSIPVFLAALRTFGLTINLSKTAALIRMAHPQGQVELRKHVVSNHKGTFLSLFGPQTELVPLVKQHKYLGCIISLFDFEVLTIRHRIEVGRNQFSRLRKILTSRKHLSLHRRARIWNACIWPSLSYGLTCCGFTGYAISKLSEVVATQLRTLARSPRHITHETNQALRERLYIPEPVQRLQAMYLLLRQRLEHEFVRLPEHDIMRDPGILAQLKHIHNMMQNALAYHPRLVQIRPQAGVPCPECGLYFVDESAVRKHFAVKHPDLVAAEPIDIDSIDREAISVDGMPICRGCHLQFCSWQKLLKHVGLRRCPGLSYDTSVGIVPIAISSTPDPVVTRAGTSTANNTLVETQAAAVDQSAEAKPDTSSTAATDDPPLPLIKRDELVKAWITGGSKTCIEALTGEALRSECSSHCSVCRQWIADTRHMKQHIQKAHPHVYARHHTNTVADCAALAGTILASQPCPYCHKSATTQPKRHASMCTVLYQVALVCRAHGCGRADGGRKGGHLTLRGLPPLSGGECTREQAPSAPSQARPSQASTTGVQGQARDPGQRQGQGQQGPHDIRTWFKFQSTPSSQHERRGGNEGNPQDAYAGIHQTRRSYQSAQAGSLFPSMDENKLAGVDASQHCGSFQGMEGEARERRDRYIPTCYTPQMHAGGTQEPCVTNGGEPGVEGQAGCSRMAPGYRGARANVESDDVEQDGGKGVVGTGSRTPGPVRCAQPDRQATGGDGLGHSPEVPFHETAGRRVSQRDGMLSSRDLEPRNNGDQTASGDVLIVPELGDVSDRSALTARNAEALPDDRQDVQGTLLAVLHLALENNGNTCYQNSFVLALLWTYISTGTQARRGHGGRGFVMQALCDGILHNMSSSLYSLQAWRDLIRDWHNPHLQHDVCEFACYALARLRPAMLQGEWLARCMDPELRDTDHGSLFSPIPMRIPPNAQAVQDCIHLWNDQDQASVHALTHSTNAVIIQLARFTRRSGGRYRKYTGSIPEMQNILMPVFTDELQTQWVPFTLCAGIIHIGRSPFSGHYRAFLLSDETSSGVGSREPHPDQYANAFITDDWIPAEAATDMDWSLIQHNAYMLWYVRAS